MPLKEYLENSAKSTYREKIFEYRLCYDIKLAAAKNDFDIQIHKPEIDSWGYDIILDDRRATRLLQLKVTNDISAGTVFSKIHKSLLLPTRDRQEIIDYVFNDYHPRIVGDYGALIATSYSIYDEAIIDVNYYYTDIILIYLFSCGVFRKYKTSEDKANKLIKKLGDFHYTDRIDIPIHLMIKVKSIDYLFPLFGIENGDSRFSSLYVSFINDIRNRDKQYSESLNLIKDLNDDKDLK